MKRVSLRRAFEDEGLFGNVLSGDSWLPWRSIMLASLGEELNTDERASFQKLTGRPAESGERVEELWTIAGRRGGKTRAAATLAVYLAALCDHRKHLAIGERGIVLFLAQNQKQAQVAFNYATGIIESVPLLRQLVTNRTADTITLSNGIDLEVRAASFRGLRGVTCVAVVADEAAFWPADESANADTEILNAVRPALATTHGPLIVISSPYAKRGEVFNTWRAHYGPTGDPRILVAKGASRDFNPSLPQSVVDRAIERDPASASAEYLGLFRSDLEVFVTREIIEACVDPGVHERPPSDARYFGFVDPSGGSSDSMTVAIGHIEGRVAIIDAIRERKPPFSPESTVAEFSELLKQRYRISNVVGDAYGGIWPREKFEQHGVSYIVANKNRSELYLALLPELNSGTVRLLDNPRLVAQLVGLERRTSRTGKDAIDHMPGQHDDVGNAVAGLVHLLRSEAVMPICFGGWGVVTSADVRGLSPVENWTAAGGYSDAARSGYRRFDNFG
jgi:hypothetical protein